jgi:hypothetical protein
MSWRVRNVSQIQGGRVNLLYALQGSSCGLIHLRLAVAVLYPDC